MTPAEVRAARIRAQVLAITPKQIEACRRNSNYRRITSEARQIICLGPTHGIACPCGTVEHGPAQEPRCSKCRTWRFYRRKRETERRRRAGRTLADTGRREVAGMPPPSPTEGA